MSLDLRMKFSADTSGLQSQIKGVSDSIRTAFGATAVTGLASLVKSVASYAGGLQDLSEQTGFSTDALQELNYAAINGGSSIEDMTTAVRKMQDVLGQDQATDDQIKALEKLGLGFNQLKAMAPEDAFKKLAGAIANIPDQMERTAVATDFFGKGGMKIAAMAGDLDKFAKAAHDAGAVVDKELIKSVAEFDDAIASSIQTVKSWGVSVIGTIQKVAASAGKLSETGREQGTLAKVLNAGLLTSNPALAGGLAAATVGRVLGDAAGGSVDKISKKAADKEAADAQADNIQKLAAAEEAAAKDKLALEKMQTEEIEKRNKKVLDGIEKARSADQKAGEDALAMWQKRIEAIKKVDEARMAVINAEKRVQEQAIAAADRADEKRRAREMQAIEKEQDAANKNLSDLMSRQSKVLGGTDMQDALDAVYEDPNQQRDRRNQIAEEERLRQLIADRMEGKGRGRVHKRDLEKLNQMADDLAQAKGFKNAADQKADAAKQEALKVQDLKDQREAAKATIDSLQELKDAKKALETLVKNLKVAG